MKKAIALLQILTSLLTCLTFIVDNIAQAAEPASPVPIIASCEKEQKNTDGTITITSPTILRGNEQLRVSGKNSESEGVCRVFGYDHYLSHTLEVQSSSSRSIALNADGTLKGITTSNDWTNTLVTSITCFDGNVIPPIVFGKKEVKKNSDETVSIEGPGALRGNLSFHLSSTSSDRNGVCRAFGFSAALDYTLESQQFSSRTIAVSAEGVYAGLSANNDYRNQIIKSISCYTGKQPPPVVFEKITPKTNPDKTITFEKPRVSRAKWSYPLSTSSDLAGVCRAYGYDDYLEATLEKTQHSSISLIVSKAGTYQDLTSRDDYRNYVIDGITCFNGGVPQVVFTHGGKKDNPDGTITISAPKAFRSKWTFPISATQSDLHGLCRSYGYSSYLDLTLRSQQNSNSSIGVNAKGQAQTLTQSNDFHNKIVLEFTCIRAR